MSEDIISWDRVAELRVEVGADDFDEIVLMFLEETETALNDLQSAADEADRRDLLHALRGSALNLGFTGLSRLCQAIEGGVDHAAGPAELTAVFARSRDALESRLKAA